MKAIAMFVVAFIAMYIDMSFANFSPVHLFGLDVYFVPRVLLIFVLLVSIYISQRMGIFIAGVSGLMLDIYIGSIYGIHTFGLIASVVFMHAAFRVFYKDFIALAFVVLVLSFLYDLYVYVIYRVLAITTMPVFDYLALRATPSLLVNAIFFTGIFFIVLRLSKLKEGLQVSDKNPSN